MTRAGNRLTPARNVAPGMIVRRELDARGWTQEDLARIMDRPVQVISEIVSAKKQITPETAMGLAAAFGTSAEMWLQMEAKHRLRLAQEKTELTDVERRSRVYSILPVKELVRRGWIEECQEVDELENQVTRFLGIDSLDELPPLKLAARRTVTRDPDPRAVIAWIRRVEVLAASQEVGTFEPRRLGEVADQLVDLSRQDDGLVQVGSILRDAGIGFVLVQHLPRTFFDGAVIWVGGTPVVALTLRHDRLDSFWSTLMHEVAHLVLGHEGGRLDDLDGGSGVIPKRSRRTNSLRGGLSPTNFSRVSWSGSGRVFLATQSGVLRTASGGIRRSCSVGCNTAAMFPEPICDRRSPGCVSRSSRSSTWPSRS